MQFLFSPSLNLERYSLPCTGFQALQLVKVETGFVQFQILQKFTSHISSATEILTQCWPSARIKGKARDRRKAMYDVYLVEEDLAAGESDVEKEVRVSEDLILAENTRPICHFLLSEASLNPR